MKKRVLAIIACLFSLTGILLAQTYADVVIEYNSAVRCLNNQAYDSAFIYLNNTLAMSDVVGAEAAEMSTSSKEQIVYANYSQAYTLEKRKKYGEAIPFYQESIRLSEEFGVKEETAAKAKRKLVSTSMRAGQSAYQTKDYDGALEHYDRVLSMAPSVYQAHQGKGLVYEKLDQADDMLGEFAIAKQKAAEKGDEKVLGVVNAKLNSYYHGLIDEELMMIDPEEADYTYLVDICDQALEANEKNAFAAYNAISAKNKDVDYDAAIVLGEKIIQFEEDIDANLLSAIFYELGMAYQNSVMYKEACASYEKVTEEPFFTKAENKMMTSNCQ
jgi:tetratricopeptide (TPR) repeat protein